MGFMENTIQMKLKKHSQKQQKKLLKVNQNHMNNAEKWPKLENCGGLTIAKIKKIGKKKVYDISVADVEHYILAENGVVTHNTGLYYSANTVWILGRQQDKDDDGLQGYHFVINVDKSRFVKEKSKVPISVSFANGVEKYSGLLDVCVDGGFVIKPTVGWYQKKGDTAKYREKDTYTAEFWKDILDSKEFKDYIRTRYTLGGEGQSGLISIVDDEADES